MYKTELFNKISPNYPTIDNDFVAEYYKKVTEFLVDHHFTREELDDFRKLIESENSLETINYNGEVDAQTINKINNIISTFNKENAKEDSIRQNLVKSISKEELNDLEVTNEKLFNINNIISLDEIRNYSKSKKEILSFCKEMDFSDLESATFIYGYIRDKYSLSDIDSKTIYETYSKKEGSIDKVNMILCDLLQSLGINVSIDKNGLKIMIKFSDNENSYSLDLLTDMNMKSIIGTENSYEAFMPELNKELKDKTILYVNKRLKEYNEGIVVKEEPKEEEFEEKEVKKESITEIPMVSDNTMTFAIPISEIQAALEKDEQPNIGIMLCKNFLESNSINNNQDFYTFLMNNGLSNNISNYLLGTYDIYNILKLKENAQISITKYPNKISYYIPTTENDNHSLKVTINNNGSLEIINSEYSNYMESGIRYGSTSINNYKENNGSILVEEKINRIRPVENITPDMIMPVYIVDALKSEKSLDNNVTELSNETQSIMCTRENDMLVPSDINEQEKMYQIRELGFEEKYYTKKQIAGLNKYSDGREIYVSEENLNISDEGGLTETNDMVLVKSSGKVNILLITGIVGFIIGLGVGLALLILNIR